MEGPTRSLKRGPAALSHRNAMRQGKGKQGIKQGKGCCSDRVL